MPSNETFSAPLALRTTLVAGSPAQGGFKNELASSEIALGRLLAATAPARAADLIRSGIDIATHDVIPLPSYR